MAIPVHPPRRRFAPARLALHCEALAAILIASLAIRLLPFPRVTALGARPARRTGGADVDAAALRGPVRGWAARVPWRAKCFETAIALRLMLARRGLASTLHYGLARADGLKAHVWLSAGGEILVGGREAGAFAEVATFPPLPPR